MTEYPYIIQSKLNPNLYVSSILPQQYVGSIHHWSGSRKNALYFWSLDDVLKIQLILERIGIETTVLRNREYSKDELRTKTEF